MWSVLYNFWSIREISRVDLLTCSSFQSLQWQPGSGRIQVTCQPASLPVSWYVGLFPLPWSPLSSLLSVSVPWHAQCNVTTAVSNIPRLSNLDLTQYLVDILRSVIIYWLFWYQLHPCKTDLTVMPFYTVWVFDLRMIHNILCDLFFSSGCCLLFAPPLWWMMWGCLVLTNSWDLCHSCLIDSLLIQFVDCRSVYKEIFPSTL